MGDNACGTLQVDLDLEPGETKQFMVILGIGKAEVEGKQVLGAFNSIDRAMEALEELKRHWHAQLESIHCRTPDGQFDSMVNVWNAYNRLITYRWSRAASLVYNGERDGLGYRDTVQDIVSAVSAIPADARQRLEMMISGQYSSGGAMPVVRPFAHRPGTEPLPDDLMAYRADDCMWLFNAVPAYVKETGDLAFFDRVLPYADAGEATVFEHLRRAIEFNFAHTGEHGLPCGLQADWNDCIEFGETGESVFVAFQLRQALLTCLDLCERLARPDTVDWAKQRLSELDAAIDAFAWDGGWFRRGTMKDGSVIGTAEAEEGRIFLNAQSWAVLSGFASGERAKHAMDAVHEQLATEYGLMVCAPPFEKASVETIRAVLMNPGHKENGGIFSHTQGWAVMAEAMLGRGDRAWAYYRAYMPAAQNEIAEVREIEPYVHCQSTHSRFSRRFGASRIPWLSGTATWSYIAATQAILGLQPDYDGLRLDPCIPADWPGFTARRRFRGATYEIDVRNPDGLCRGVQRLTVDGNTVAGNLIPLAESGQTIKVEATLEA
jgi:cellobiose phosphorylase